MFNFLKFRVAAMIFSLVAILAFVGLYFQKGGLTYSVEFTGGTQVLLNFKNPVDSGKLLSVIREKWDGAVVREFSNKQILVRTPVKSHKGDARGLANRILEVVQKSFSDNPVNVDKSEVVGPGVGADLRWKSTRAVLLALILMLLYIAWQFWSLSFAIGAVAALLHDAIMMLFIMLIFGREISINVIGAILIVLGYSINDTIVIFSRMRENIKKLSGTSLYELVNMSLNQTFKRTILTSFSTFLAAGSMFLFGGEILKDLSIILLIGIIFGTYSSIYIASPIMMLLYKKNEK